MPADHTPDRRAALAWIGAGASFLTLAACGGSASAKTYPVSLTQAQWRKKLTGAQFYILRQEGTERPFTSKLLNVKTKGVFSCAGCGNDVYATAQKFDSGTGWPSFWAPIRASAVGTSRDLSLGIPRTEVHCARCGGHLGHIFDDGPQPTGKRHCINGVAMNFAAA